MNFKWIMVSSLLAASLAFAACGDDETDAPCETDADCASGEVCIGLEGARECEILCDSDDDCDGDQVCIQVPDIDPAGATVCEPPIAEQECSVDADCAGTGATCVEGFCVLPAACDDDSDCDAGEVCEAGACIVPTTEDECETTADCIDQTAYCAEIGGTSQCLDVSCGSDLNSCSRCELGPSRSPNGPVIFFPQQVGTCSQDPNQCLPGAAPWVCEFSFQAFGDDLPTSNLNNRIRVISARGDELTVFGTKTSQSGNNRQYNFRACFPDTSSGNIGTAVVLRDNSNDASNTLCVDGSLQ